MLSVVFTAEKAETRPRDFFVHWYSSIAAAAAAAADASSLYYFTNATVCIRSPR